MQGSRRSQERGEAARIVADSRATEEITLSGYTDVGSRREDGVEVGRHDERRLRTAEMRLRIVARSGAQNVSGRIGAGLAETRGGHEFGHPLPPSLFLEGASRDLRELHLTRECQLVRVSHTVHGRRDLRIFHQACQQPVHVLRALGVRICDLDASVLNSLRHRCIRAGVLEQPPR